MRHTSLSTSHLRLLVSMALVWLFATLAAIAIEPRRSECVATATEVCCSTELDEESEVGVEKARLLQYAQPAEDITLTTESRLARAISSQARTGHRTSGGRTFGSALHATQLHHSIHHTFFHFTLASAGVAFITSRACDYYVFALRRILD